VRLHPLFLSLEGRSVLLVGGGPVSLEKARQLAGTGARVRVVAPEVLAELASVVHEVSLRPFEERDLDGVWLVYAAAPPHVNRAVQRAAEARRLFVVAVDDVGASSAFGAGVLERAGVTLAISSAGRAPALVALLRRALEAVLPAELDEWMALAEAERARWKEARVPIGDRRPLLLRALVALHEPAREPSPRPRPPEAAHTQPLAQEARA
jgi:siroheme synthase-like protein